MQREYEKPVLGQEDIQCLQEVGLVVQGKYPDVNLIVVSNSNNGSRGKEIPVSPIKVICDRRISTAFMPRCIREMHRRFRNY